MKPKPIYVVEPVDKPGQTFWRVVRIGPHGGRTPLFIYAEQNRALLVREILTTHRGNEF